MFLLYVVLILAGWGLAGVAANYLHDFLLGKGKPAGYGCCEDWDKAWAQYQHDRDQREIALVALGPFGILLILAIWLFFQMIKIAFQAVCAAVVFLRRVFIKPSLMAL
ncbi:MAG: hypothetical protein V1846_04645 [Candidatus Komeilibacteria bacterium]